MFALSVFLRERLLARTTFVQDKVRIGRTEDNEVHLDNLGVSRSHASIERVGGVHILKEFGSGNGTFVNGEKVVGRRALDDGDRITIGKFLLVFRGERSVPESAVAPHSSYDLAGQTIVTESPLHGPERRCPFIAYLELPHGPTEPPLIHRLERDVCLVGTSGNCDLVLERGSCPPHAALLLRGWQGFTLFPLVPGVRRNGAAIVGRVRLGAKDELAFGSQLLRFFMTESEAAP
jgi:hypothetical protein